MIDRLELNNFQKHKKINIEFKKGLNIIVGPSDAGKSAIFRSLDFILFNGAKKSNIITNGQKQTEVIIDIDDMCVRRIKGSNTNKYYLDDMEFKAFGTKPPKEISDIINLGDVNIQDQHSKPFLISETPGEVAKYLNNLINIDTIDKLNSVFISKQKKIKNNIKLVREDYEDIKKTYDKNKTLLGKLKIRFIDLEDRSRLKEKKQEEVETLIDLIDQYEDNSKIFTDRHSELKKEYSRISRYYNKVLELGDKMYILRKIVNKKPGEINIDFDRAEKLFKSNVKLCEIKNLTNNLKKLIQENKDNEEYFNPEDLKNALDELRTIVDICPLCKRRW